MKNKITSIAAILAVGSMLSGCVSLGANTEDDFFCEAQAGSPCATIGSTDGTKANQTIGITETVEDGLLSSIGNVGAVSEKEQIGLTGISQGQFAYETSRYRIPEELSQLWIAPYLDENQLFHQGRFVHFVVRDAQWVTR